MRSFQGRTTDSGRDAPPSISASAYAHGIGLPRRTQAWQERRIRCSRFRGACTAGPSRRARTQRLPPANERFEAAETIVVQRDDRLLAEFELVLQERIATLERVRPQGASLARRGDRSRDRFPSQHTVVVIGIVGCDGDAAGDVFARAVEVKGEPRRRLARRSIEPARSSRTSNANSAPPRRVRTLILADRCVRTRQL
jgi:hypothetical protein